MTQKKGKLTRSADFDSVYRQGRSRQNRHMVVYRFDRPSTEGAFVDEPPRIGVTVSKKVGNSVIRNKTKRQLFEAMKTFVPKLGNNDVVVVAKPGLPVVLEKEGWDWLLGSLAELLGEERPNEDSPEQKTENGE